MTPIGQTERGFYDFAKFTDTYGNEVTVRESSSAEGAHLWIFVDGEVHLQEKPHPHPGIPFGVAKASASTHMNLEQVEVMRDAFTEYLEFAKTRWEGGA